MLAKSSYPPLPPPPPPKKTESKEVSNPKKASDHPRHLTSGVPLPRYRVIQFINRLNGNETNMITVSCWKSHHYLWKAAIINRHAIISNLKKKIHKVIIIDWNGKARQGALAVFTLHADHPPLKGYKSDNPCKTGNPPFKKAMLAVKSRFGRIWNASLSVCLFVQ